MYCKQHPVLQKNVPAWNEERLKKILDDDIAKHPDIVEQKPAPTKPSILDDPNLKINWRD